MSDQHYNSELKEWYGVGQQSVWNPHSSIGNILFFCLSQHPQKVAQIFADDGSTMTYEALNKASTRVALNLRRLEIKEGDVVSMICYNNKDVWSIILGCTFIGVTFSCLHPNISRGMFEIHKNCAVIDP